jgi:2-methylcitrate dehydratase PrpD
VCNIADPSCGLEAKFSLRHAVAMAIAGLDTAALASYSDEQTADPELQRLRERVRVELHADCPKLTQAEVVIKTTAGATLRQRHDSGVPASDLRAQRARLERKFRSMATPVVGADLCGELIELVDRLDDLPDLSPLAGLLAGMPVPPDSKRH